MTMASSFRGAWRHRRWRWLLASFAVSSIGDFFYFIAIIVFLIESTASPSWLAAAAVARLLAYALFGTLGGVIAERYDRRRLMVVLDVARAGVMMILAVVVWNHGPPALVIGLTVLNSIASTPYRPALVAATPALVHEDDLAAANAAEGVVGQLAYFIGPAFGGLVVATVGAGTAFIVNAFTFIVSAVLLARIGPVGGGRGAGDAAAGKPASARSQIADGLRTVRAQPGIAALIAFSGIVVFLYGFEQVVHVLVATNRLGMSASGVGILGGAIGVGGLLVAPFTARLGDGPSTGRLLALSGVLMGLPLALLALISSPVVAVIALFVEGAGGIAFEVLFITLLQRATPEDMLARVFGLQDSVTSVAQLLGLTGGALPGERCRTGSEPVDRRWSGGRRLGAVRRTTPQVVDGLRRPAQTLCADHRTSSQPEHLRRRPASGSRADCPGRLGRGRSLPVNPCLPKATMPTSSSSSSTAQPASAKLVVERSTASASTIGSVKSVCCAAPHATRPFRRSTTSICW